MEWYVGVLKKYAEFGGWARRKEFWMFLLFIVHISLALGIVDALIGFGLLGALYALAVLVPSIAVSVRRLHDTGRSGWWVLIGFVPLIGLIVLIVFAVQEGQAGSNAYGPDPKAAAA